MFLLLIFPSIAQECAYQKPKVHFYMPDENHFFWDNMSRFMQHAANSLGIDLTVKVIPKADRNRFTASIATEKYLLSGTKPDYLISYLWLGGEDRILQVADKLNVPLITLNSNLSDDIIKKTGFPRQKYKNWLAHIEPDDFIAGYQLSKSLLKQQRKVNSAAANIVIVSGSHDSSAHKMRSFGLNANIEQHPEHQILQYIYTDWSADDAEQKSIAALKRFNDIDVIWAASDNLAYGINRAIKKAAPERLTSIILGSIDWSPEVLPLIKKGEVTLSLGGHFLDGSWALVLLFDHFNGFDFIERSELVINTQLSVINKNNVERMQRLINPPEKVKYDFTYLSRCFNNNISDYQFDGRAFFNRLINRSEH